MIPSNHSLDSSSLPESGGHQAAEQIAAADRRALMAMALVGFSRASQAVGMVEHNLQIFDQRIRLCFAGSSLADALLPALAHLKVEASESEPSLTLHLWDSESTATNLPLMLEGIVQLWRHRWWEVLDTRREVKAFCDASTRTVFHLGPDILSILDLSQNRGVYWVKDGTSLPYYERGSPITALLSWWLESRGRILLHAAAISEGQGCVLLPGKGGSGKSTTTLACLDSGLRILGDDYCALQRNPEPQIHSLYNTCKLKGREDVEMRFSHLRHLVSNIDHLETEKALIFLHEHAADVLIRQAPLRAILLPRVTGERDTHLRPAAAGQALRFLAPSTMFQFPGDAGLIFRESVSLIRQLPVWELALGTDLSQIPQVIRGVLRDLAPST